MKNNKKEKNQINTSFIAKVILHFILFIVLIIGGISLLINSFSFIQPKNINFAETSSLDYKVYLKENDFYDSPYLGKDMLYVANLIDKINVNFKYNFNADEFVNLKFKYKIIGKLSIMDANDNNTYFEKEYTLLNEKEGNLLDTNNYNINENINIDYGYYNSIANNFKMSYGVETSSKFVVYLMIDKTNLDNLNNNDTSSMVLSIPLSLKSVNIKMDYKDINNTNYLIGESNLETKNIIYIVISMLLIISSIIIFIKIMRLIDTVRIIKSKYDKYVNRLLNEYDRLIVETTTCPTINEENTITINKFEELLDVRDNLKLPIMYFVVKNHQKCYFYIIHNDKVYLNVVKETDIKKNKH